MSWVVLAALAGALVFALLVTLQRRADLGRMSQTVIRRDEAVKQGAAEAELQHPVVDLSRCLGCATCVAACPEDGVLDLVHGQAAVVRGARCIGAGACERECPVDAITVTLGDTSERDDVPALTQGLEAVGAPGLWLAGEVTAHALIRTAVEHGARVAAAVAERLGDDGPRTDDAYDLCIVGAGPAGLSASLEAKRLGLTFVTIDQAEEIGGTVARYPRAKLVTTQPIELPLYGRLRRTSYEKEELVELWNEVAREQELPVHGGLVFQGVDRDGEHLVVDTSGGPIRARHVCLALGRRGAPRKLGVPGEELGKVSYALLDARSYAGRRALVVGGGDSAVEAALALGEQAGAEVTLSYRREAFFRIKALNERRLDEAVRAGRVRLALGTEVTAIEPDAVRLRSAAGAEIRVANDAVFALIGGIAPTEVLRASGVSFDPGLRDTGPLAEEAGTGLVKALAWALALTICVLAFAAWNLDYYGLSRAERPAHEKHDLLRPGKGLGLWLGIASIGLVAANLLYLVRRSPRVVARLAGLPIGSLKGWMTSHVATGVLAFLLALLHAAMAPRNTVGSHALWALLALLVTGAIGRYFYAWLPRAANGEELDLDGVKRRLDALAGDWDREHRAFGAEAQARVLERVRTRQWGTGFFGRVVGLVRGDEERKELVVELRASGAAQGLSPDQVAGVVALAEQAWRSASRAAHLEDARALLGTWRYLHRWIAALMVALAVLHIGHVLFYGGLFSGSSDDLRQLTRAAEVTR